MKKLNLLLVSLFIGAFSLTSCSSSDDSPTGGGNGSGTIQPGTAVNPANMKMAALSGFVKTKEGNAIKGVTVTSGTTSVTTGADGGFILETVNSVNGRTIVTFEADGYTKVTRAAKTLAGDVWEVAMNYQWGGGENITSNDFNSANPTYMETQSKMKVSFQADGFKTESGTPATGYVSAEMTYLNPDEENFAELMPGGDLAAVNSNGQDVQLISYGMTEVNMRNSNTGEKLQLADGKPATLTFPIPDKFKDNTPNEIPLWSFNEETGLWVEEGTATLQDGVYVGTVTHFSWVNLDYPQTRTTLQLVVKDLAGNVVPNVKVDIDGQKSVYTNVKGEAETFVPTNTAFYVTIHSADYANYDSEVKINIPAIAEGITSHKVEINLPTLAHISGKVVNEGEGNNLATLWIEYDGKSTKTVHSDKDGQFFMNAPASYKGAALLKVRTSDGTIKAFDITLDGKDQAVTINIKSDVSSGGTVKAVVTGTSKTFNFTIQPVYFEDFNGVCIVDDSLSINIYSYDESQGQSNSINLGVSGFKEGKSDYKDVYFSCYQSREREYTEVFGNTLTAKITQPSTDSYRFQVEGAARTRAEGITPTESDPNSTVQADFTMPLLFKGQALTNVSNKNIFPSFTPWLTGKTAARALNITESPKLGKGALIWYYDSSLGKTDFDNLVGQAKSTLGEPFESYTGQEQDMSYAYFYNNGKFVMISFCPWREGEEGKDEYFEWGNYSFFEHHMARIQVHVFDGLLIPYTTFTQGHPQSKGKNPIFKSRFENR